VLHNANDDYIELDADIGERIRRTARDIESCSGSATSS
jgi:hypothetical protein